jgi:hypothetical protein
LVKFELMLKGTKGNLVIRGNTFAEVIDAYECNRKKIETLLGERAIPIQELGKPRLVPTSSQGRISAMIAEGFFQSPKTAREVKVALKEKGYTYDFQRVSISLMRLVRKKYLRRLTEERKGKEIYVYVNP